VEGPEAVGVEVAEPIPATGDGEGESEAGLAPQLIRAVPNRDMAYGIPYLMHKSINQFHQLPSAQPQLIIIEN